MRDLSGHLPNYKSFWLRCWQIDDQKANAPTSWRFSLEDPVTGHKRGFTNIKELITYLQSELDCEGGTK